ncbi:MAG TPA: alpha-2-macroglobulin [Alphaproteobacteria bacterium]|nr:alpha-2-macroglobulin [Alphaproteobacteria bacterium]
MRRLARFASRVGAITGAILFTLAVPTSASAAERSITLLEHTDLPGFDYSVLEDTTLDECEEACADDRICRAFTYNDKADWCFLKGDVGPAEEFRGATSGTVGLVPSAEAIAAARQSELPFPAEDLISGARYFAQSLPQTDPPPPDVPYAELVAAGEEALAQSNPIGAMVSFRQALAINDNDPAVWLNLAEAALTRAEFEARQNGSSSYDLGVTATYAALNAFLQSETVGERASAMAALARALEHRQMWRESIATYRASLALVDDAALQERLDKAVAEHGFRVVSHEVDSEAETPRICAVFSDPLPTGETDLSSYVVVEGTRGIAVETEQSQICLTGVEFGRRYNIRIRSGLPSADGETLRADVELNVYVPDRAPFVGFANNAYVMPAGLGGGLPITSVNAETADVAIYRIGDRSIATAVRNGIFQGTLDGYSAEDVANQYGEKVWEGQADLADAAPNTMVTTALPVDEALGDRQPGAYVITARVTGSQQEYWQELATQWFIITDLGMTTVSGEDGVHVFVRSLTSAAPVASAYVRLIAVNNEVLGEASTDADGRATFAPGLARGEAGRAPQLVVAETDGGDYAFLDVSKTAFDLTDRGVEGRPSPGPLDAFATTERGVYRPGETVFVTALLRDTKAKAVAGLPLTMEIERPDGVVAEKRVLGDQGAGGYFAEVALVDDAMRGSWQVRFHADPGEPPLTSATFLVEDFEPERLAFEVSAPDAPLAIGEPAQVSVAAKYLYGATAPNLTVEADAIVRPRTDLEEYPGYTFGRLDDTFQTYYEPLGTVGLTDEAGNAVAEITLPDLPATTRPLEAQIVMRLIDTSGRTVQRSLTRPVRAQGDRIGVRPRFKAEDGLPEGSEAAFDVIAVAPDGEMVDKAGLHWTISRVETNYQWFREGGVWKWEAVTATREVANGTIDATASGPVTLSSRVEWGRYRLEVNATGEGPTSTSYEFYAGYYYPEAGSDTPDKLQVALDKPAYRPGETASLRLDPQFAGTALVMVVDDRIIDMRAVEVPEEGISVPLTVTDDWGPGAYVTAMLYRPADAAEKRMPARALGLAFAEVAPGDLQLDVSLEAPRETRPRAPLSVTVELGNAAAGETAYVTVAAVDLGILNLTNFPVPDPDGWYFGQRQLGVEIRDLYGRLIDPTQGMPGALRSGGDGGAARVGTPPAVSVLVAMHSGIVTVGPDGTATVTFDIPDFAGTVRVMAMAWTASQVGHAAADVIVRDPVVVTLSPPRFLRLDDTSRLLVEVNNVDGPPGTYTLELIAGDGIETDSAETSVELAAGARTALALPLTAAAIGDHELRLIVTDPDGNAMVKSLTLGVRAASAPQTASRVTPLAPGASVTLDESEFAGMVPATGSLTLAVGPIARLDVPGLLLQLDRYPYGCAEQVTSRAIALIYLNEVAQMLGLGTDAELDGRIADAIADLLSKQNSAGGFGLWGPFSTSDLWLDSYVTDYLLRARAAGYDVPETALSRALDNLGNQVSYAPDFNEGGEDIAYALYDLAKAGRAAIGDLRYYLEAKLDAFGSPLAKAQLGAALALYGDRTRAATAFAAAAADLRLREERDRYRMDYGSRLRDAAGVLTLAAEFRPAGIDIAAFTAQVAGLRDIATYTSTQEDAWTLLAAANLARDAGDGAVTIDGEELSGSVYRRYHQEQLEGESVTIANTGNQPTEIKVSVTAIPATPPPAGSAGFIIERAYYRLDGTPADLGTVGQNDRFVVVLTMTPRTLGSGHYLVADPLPAGFEIENPDLSQGAGVGDLSWLKVDYAAHVEARTDQFIAAFRYVSQMESVTTAYMVRAVSPGTFVMPGATVEDMYRPELRGNTDAGAIEVTAVGQ